MSNVKKRDLVCLLIANKYSYYITTYVIYCSRPNHTEQKNLNKKKFV